MQIGMTTPGLSLEQAPPLSIPASFFLTVPLSLLVAGSILMLTGAESLSHLWNPQVIALTHVGTVGVLLMGMIGALYQMTPVVAGAPVPAIRLAHAVHFMLLFGLACFVWRLLGGSAFAMTLARHSLGLALLGFLLPVSWSLAKCATRNETVLGMRLAVASLAAIAAMGLVMAGGYVGASFPENRFLWTQVHLTLALLGWVGGLIVAVSWQVLPMFYLVKPARRITMKALLAALLIGLVLPFAAFMIGASDDAVLSATEWAAVASLPAALAIWFVHPLLTLRSIAQRRRRRSDASLLFWRAGLTFAVLLLPLAVLSCFLIDPRWQILFGWIAIWGWAGMIMHGMLIRIVPFLVWFHRITPLIGELRVPSIRQLLSQGQIRIGYSLHLISIVLGAATIVTQVDMLAQLTGAMVAATGISLGSSLLHVLGKGRGMRLSQDQGRKLTS
jgi:hypothetical protein